MADINYAAVQKAIDRLNKPVKTNLFEVFPVYSEGNEDKIQPFADCVISFTVSNKYIDVYVHKNYIKFDNYKITDEGLYDFLPREIEGFTLDLLTQYGGVWKRIHLKCRAISDEQKERREKLREKFPNIDTNKEEILYDCTFNDHVSDKSENYYHFVYEFFEQTIEMCNLETNRN